MTNGTGGRRKPNIWAKDLLREDSVAGHSIWWWVFFLPGKIMLWFEYMFPRRLRGVFGTARRIKSPIVQVWYSLSFYAIVLIVSVLLISQHR